MSPERSSDLAHSVQERLRSRARVEGRLYQDLLVRHGLERFLHRLGETHHRDRFILKGALLLQVWTDLDARPTRDIDLLGPIGLQPDELLGVIRDCVQIEVEPDGWSFDAARTVIQQIREAAVYSGLRAVFEGSLGSSRVKVQLDVGVGDEVVPAPTQLSLPSLLGQPAPDLLCYSPYTAIAEKLDAMLVLGFANSRMKDYFDIAYLAGCMEFSGAELSAAITACCSRRRTTLPRGQADGLSESFAIDEQAQERWRSFVRKSGLGTRSLSWPATVETCMRFLREPLSAAADGRAFDRQWSPGGPWVSSRSVDLV